MKLKTVEEKLDFLIYVIDTKIKYLEPNRRQELIQNFSNTGNSIFEKALINNSVNMVVRTLRDFLGITNL